MNITIVDSIGINLIHKDGVIVGVGNELYLYTNESPSIKLQKPFQLNGKIHGIEQISKDDVNLLLIHGENELLLIKYSLEWRFTLVLRYEISDWISSVKFLKDVHEFVVLTAHSVLLRFEFILQPHIESSDNYRLIEKISSSDKSTLYCSKIYGDVLNNLIIFGGNAFGELLVWQPLERKDENRVQLLHRIQAHNGVIFSIDYCEASQLIITTSDDRSIRFWKINESIKKYKQLDKQSLSMIATGYGHVARVFKGKFIRHKTEIYAITVGEDSYFCIWSKTGELVFKRRQQFGATIWNFVYDEQTSTLYSTGSSGNLLAFGLRKILEKKLETVSIMDLSNNECVDEYIAKVQFINHNLLIGLSNKNKLVYKYLNENKDWIYVKLFEPYKCTVLTVYKNLIALCGYKRVTLLAYDEISQFTKMFDQNLLDGIIRSFHFLSNEHYLVSDELGNCVLLRGKEIHLQCSVHLPKCKERWITSALLINDRCLLICNRQGNLLLFKIVNNGMESVLCNILHNPHGNLGATALNLIEINNECGFVRSAGHDGSMRVLAVNLHEFYIEPYSRESIPIAWVEKIVNMKDSIFFLGFNDNHFVAWSKDHDFVLQVACGGGHRCWHYNILRNVKLEPTAIKLAFIKNKQIRLHALNFMNNLETAIRLPVRNSWHVRSCNIANIFKNPENNDIILVSAGDDNLLKVFRYNKEHKQLLQSAEIHSHISNIRAMKIMQLEPENIVIVSGGGRAQLCVNKLNLITFKTKELVNYTVKDCYEDNKHYAFNPETRIMSIDIYRPDLNSSDFDVFIGCSDGYVRKISIFNTTKVAVLKPLFYGKCILQIRLIKDLYVIVAATDGYIKFYNLSLDKNIFELRHHFSGVNGLDVHLDNSQNTLHILSGGDDQAIVYSKLIINSNDESLITAKEIRIPFLHTAKVTGACLNFHKGTFGYTTGVDQNLYKLDLNTGITELVKRFCVANIKGICLLDNDVCFIYGCGLQIYTLK